MAEAQGEPQDANLVVETLIYLATALVAHPESVRVERTESERGSIYRLHVHPDDIGRVIGKGGRLARAIRRVARASAARADAGGVIVEIGE